MAIADRKKSDRIGQGQNNRIENQGRRPLSSMGVGIFIGALRAP
jgi:hypothetical protein